MKSFRVLVILFAALAATPVVTSAQVTVEYAFPRRDILPKQALGAIDVDGVTLRSPADAAELIERTLKQVYTRTDFAAKDTHVLIHLMEWLSKPGGAGPAPGRERWYVFTGAPDWSLEQLKDDQRLFGTASPFLLYVHLNVDAAMQAKYEPVFKVTTTKRTPANQAALQAALKLVPGASEIGGAPAPSYVNVWGGGQLSVPRTSDIQITGSATIGANPATASPVAFGTTAKMLNEGRTWWDVSVAVPIRASSDLKTNADGVVEPTTVEPTNLFGVFNFFPRPIDLHEAGFRRIPHLIAGVTLTEKPTDRVLLGGAWGLSMAEFYVAYIWTRGAPPPADSTEKRKYDGTVSFGVNLPVKAIADRLKKK